LIQETHFGVNCLNEVACFRKLEIRKTFVLMLMGKDKTFLFELTM